MPTATPVTAAEAPKEMTRDDRRIVFAKLNDVYLGEHEGYSAGWTDAKVADDLGVPRAWIATIREENFGPVRENEASVALRAELKRLQEAHDSIIRTSLEIENDVSKRMVRLRADGDRVKGEMQALAGRIDRAL